MQLQSQDHRDLLDIIDKLRHQGLSRYVDLPQIVVCGDQSAGKSSVLEAISRMSFPAKDNLCTRFATELILRRDSLSSAKVSIHPAVGRSSEDCERLSKFHVDIDSSNVNLTAAVEAAKSAMELSDERVFSKDILRVELCGPTQPHLTMVDLPGIFRAGSRNQSVEDAVTVREMVRDYIKRPRSIILAVVSAKSDFNLQDVTEFAKEVDPDGVRTLGLITKPDTLDDGSESEAFYVNLARNADVILRLGWHVLLNRSYATKDITSEERDRREADFFKRGIWNTVESRIKGVNALVLRLSAVLKDQILDQLPALLQDVEEGISGCQQIRKRLGVPRHTVEEHRQYLLQVSQDFSSLMKSAIDGVYSHKFFGSAKTDSGYCRRLRAVIQNILSDFAERMRLKGQQRIISDDLNSSAYGHSKGAQISQKEYVDEVKTLMRRSRGCELPGTFSPLLIGELFSEQCRPWEELIAGVKQDIMDAVYETIKHALVYVTTSDIAADVFRIVDKRIVTFKTTMDQKVVELLQPHQQGHPITYNHYLTDNVQKTQGSRRARELEATFKQALAIPNLKEDSRYKMFPLQLLGRLQQRTQVDMERYASELAVDYMQAYYKVALKKVVDDVSILAIEQCLVKHLPSLFDPQMVYSMTEQDLLRLTSESEDITRERVQCLAKLATLEAAQSELRRLDRYRLLTLPTVSTKQAVVDEGSNEEVVETLYMNHTKDDTEVLAAASISEPVAVEDDGLSGEENTPTLMSPHDDWGVSPKKTKKQQKTANALGDLK